MKLALICAMSENRVIGRDNGLPWHLPADLQYFKSTTMGNCMIMGRNTWESIGRALPGRTSIVITSKPGYQAEGAELVGSLEQAVAACPDNIEVHGQCRGLRDRRRNTVSGSPALG